MTKTITVKGGEFAVEADGRLRPVETYYINSDESYPMEGVHDADRLIVKDTGDRYLFDETGKQWLPW